MSSNSVAASIRPVSDSDSYHVTDILAFDLILEMKSVSLCICA